MLMRAATFVQQLCKSCRTCFMFYCMFYFTCDRSFRPFFFSLPPNLRCRSIDRHHHQTLQRDLIYIYPARFIKLGQKFGVHLPKNFGGQETSKFRQFGYLIGVIANISPNATRYRWAENVVASCDLSRTCTVNLTNFGPAKDLSCSGVNHSELCLSKC